jgi:4a-hydroxytetrahydrobiopterin dehydratase
MASMNLAEKKCVPCEGGTPPLTPGAVAKYLDELETRWENVESKKIRREFKWKNFKEAMVFVNKVAGIAESEGHHPNIHIFYNRVTLELWTHAVKGLSENDFIMARKIEIL